ncbi:hypothetical protein Poli38472_010065 [Pythium oligandrum]|uniref:Rab-GAP TBC domain-containing protein n=1 Tax=Pythium oligandrum TaxID=41045 RepID=A0A8K1C897_PYTOL|nr:hypothetical protein Poli38472_010065 [Pythium oligandrum]|eukprot:TMW58506.1 hypothetical protein Poli38472_010065 [Pythium oligandrum]
MSEEQLDSMDSTMCKRPSIGMANLLDALPTLDVQSPRSRKRKRKVAASPATELVLSAHIVPLNANQLQLPFQDGALRTASPLTAVGNLAKESPLTPSPKGRVVSAKELFDAIPNDNFFEVIAAHGVEFCGSEDEAQAIHERASEGTDGGIVINVNDYQDAAHGKTLLHQACRMGSLQVIKCLLYHGADIMKPCTAGRTPAHDTISGSQRSLALTILKTLYDHEPSVLQVVDTNGTHVVHLAAIHGCLDVLQWCTTLHKTPITLAITSFSGRNVLHYAAYNGRLAVLQWLLAENNRDPARRELSIMSHDVNGYTVLHYAAMGSHLDICEWLVLEAPTRHEVSITAANSDGRRPIDLTQDATLQDFLEEISQLPSAPTRVRCLGADRCSLGVSWTMEPLSDDPEINATLAPLWYELEYCKKPPGLRRSSKLLQVMQFLPIGAATVATASASSYLLKWEKIDVLIQPDTCEYWLGGLESDCEYLIRMRAVNRNGYGEYSVPQISSEFTTISNNSSSGVTPFIGTVELELLEARRLPAEMGSRYDATVQDGRYYSVFVVDSQANAKESRSLYRVRSDFATIQQDLLLAGSLNASRHPGFSFCSRFRVPETSDATLTIEIRRETTSVSYHVIGTATLSLMELVRGYPAKISWVPLESQTSSSCGELLLRSLFLADGITALPHPTRPELLCCTAEELLDESPADPLSPKPTEDQPRSPLSRAFSDSELVGKYDALGFKVFPSASQTRSYDCYHLHHECMATQQERQWLAFHRKHTGDAGASSDSLYSALLKDESALSALYESSPQRDSLQQLRRLVWDGIPPHCRRVLYMRLSGAEAKKRAACSSYYQQQLERARAGGLTGFEAARKQIQVDLQRTFAGHQSWINSTEGQGAMERVLVAYAVHNAAVGYRQSMSYLVGRLLCLFHSRRTHEDESNECIEEDVFWMIVTLCEDYFPSYFAKGMEGLHIDGMVLERLLATRLPNVTRHFQLVLQNQVQTGLLLVTGWLLPVFTAGFPSETSFRLLDVVLLERSSVVFALVLALLRMARPQILGETRDYMQLFRCLKDRDRRLYDTALLMEIAYEEHDVIQSKIDGLRRECAGEYANTPVSP